MLEQERFRWKNSGLKSLEKGFFYSVNVQIEGRAVFGASLSNAELAFYLITPHAMRAPPPPSGAG
jgi:hypothetical protein